MEDSNLLTSFRDSYLLDCKRSFKYMFFYFMFVLLVHLFIVDMTFFESLLRANLVCVCLWLISQGLNKLWPKRA